MTETSNPQARLPSDEVAAAADVVLLTAPADGLPPVVSSPDALHRAQGLLYAGFGPVAVDAERAHGYRYSQRAYLLQLRRQGAGTVLIDPIPLGEPADLSGLADTIADAEWVLHAASQDLPCLYEIGMVPRRLFDTELAARLLDYPRVALGTMLEQLLHVHLRKEHSAADWSTRPIPADWLTYAALDVELLIDLRNVLADRLAAAGKLEWAEQEFSALVAQAGTAPTQRLDPWRRTSGMHKIRTRRQLSYVVELWTARDQIARRLDRAPGRVLPDVAITELAAAPNPGPEALRRIPAFGRRQARRFEADWLRAIRTASRLRESELPPMHIASEGPPPPRMWSAKDPAAAARLTAVRDAVGAQAAAVQVPLENLVAPDHLRRLAWRPPRPTTTEAVDEMLAQLGARPWQRERVVPLITPLLAP